MFIRVPVAAAIRNTGLGAAGNGVRWAHGRHLYEYGSMHACATVLIAYLRTNVLSALLPRNYRSM